MNVNIPPIDGSARDEAETHQQHLTKPPGSLGRLENLSVRIAGITGDPQPALDSAVVVTMAGDHGVVTEGVSAFPQEVTQQMIENFAAGGAGVNVLARTMDLENLIVDVGTATDINIEGVIDAKVGYGTANIAEEPAMTRKEAVTAIEAGREVVAVHAFNADILGLGDMGIGNTTPSAAVTTTFTSESIRDITGRGTGIDDDSYEQKIAVIKKALNLHNPNPVDPIDVLATVGGYEIGGLAGVVLEGASRRIPIVVDGFITGAAALVAVEIEPGVAEYLLPSHSSVESGHAIQLDALGLDPLFDFEMRLGEGTGAAIGISVARGACSTHREMATFEEAGVSK
ncbi:nicotinate-nucleotide--dimethylbenzimidazole phosphoribosyltransferase [Halorussus sp. AFM4]|uniref:nicotinate-nucleotide--dimethylbenzimidazole phosphoribosyltransferase n=1 Tax=Halorussus sp. AFM4 TaxID=3421651 RepID=UPI003EB98C7B